MIIAIDGPSASGKSTTAKAVSKSLGFVHLDTGAMYRAVTLGISESKIEPNDHNKVKLYLKSLKIEFDQNDHIVLNGKNVTDLIRTVKISSNVSKVSAIPEVREKMVQVQRNIAGDNNCVLEGRDIGTVVFPNADFKFFLIADIDIRAKRRFSDLQKSNELLTLNELIESIRKRDELDSKRDLSPLKQAKDAIVIDTSFLTIEQQVNKIVKIVKRNKKRKHKEYV
ncbi:MAG: cytidylate kinase [Candidatus Marinimicrobia bacterium]|nr:cytidylate kinase [Candidatus Neomarinimicrobiota bacterium]|tara:strand:+ start:2910 stop:3584 length:675 start_codon:yes stop_codon:yes gene_type:complete